MRFIALFISTLMLFFLHPDRASAMERVHHNIRVALDPAAHRLSATDRITLPAERPDRITFRLHAGLEPQSKTPGAAIEKIGEEQLCMVYRVGLPPGVRQFSIRYAGQIHHELAASDPSYARGIQQTAGQISDSGVYLDGGSFWYPDFGQKFLTFDLQVELPEGWKAVSQGSRERRSEHTVAWSIDKPQDQIFLVAGRFTEYTRKGGRVTAMVFLRRPEPELAERYLSATERYIAMYEALIGPYPYEKFALVENFWETGYGMPSFTLMGPTVIRFPFILHSSYPHEILHNWWGNSVYPVYPAGNWAEGLTAYLSDHLLKAQQGEAVDYRQTVLQKYADYVSTQNDFPLTGFTARHNPETEAVGYGKGMMFFHMLRRSLGDETFRKGLQAFYQRYKFNYAAFDDLRQTFEAVSGRDLSTEFRQWVDRAGAPELAVKNAASRKENGQWVVTATLEQRQDAPPYVLTVPAAVTLEGEKMAREITIAMDRREKEIRLAFAGRPLRIDIDPQYDLFRKLARAEIPPALSQVYGAETLALVLPAGASEKMKGEYRRFAEALARSGPEKADIVYDRELNDLPADSSVVLFGWDNRFREGLSDVLAEYGRRLIPDALDLPGQTVARSEKTVVVTARHPANPGQTLAWIAAETPDALPGLARKLPHYHKYSYLVFSGKEPENVAKGCWPVRRSPMTVFFGDQTPEMGELARRPPLIEAFSPVQIPPSSGE